MFWLLIWLGCPGCFNKDVQNFDHGEEFTEETIRKLIELSAPDWISGISILGGEPLHPRNRREVLDLVKKFKEVYPNKTVWLWTGYLWEEVAEDLIGSGVDVVVDGRFIEELKDLRLKYCGSKNQRIISVKDSTRDNIITIE